MARIFVYDGREHPDPDPNLSTDQVKSFYAGFFPEVANADMTSVKKGDDTVYSFQRRVGTKG